MKFCLSLLACIAISFYSFSQTIPQNSNVTDAKGLRQGKWTILYDHDWKTINIHDSAVFYRVIEYRDDKPQGTVKDYYRSGQVQWEGILLEDRPKDVRQGISSEFSEDGRRTAVRHYENGTLKKETNYNLDGSEVKESITELDNLGSQAFRTGDTKKAKEYFDRAAAQVVRQNGPNHTRHAFFLNSIAKIYETEGKYTQAEEVYLSAEKVQRSTGKNHTTYALIVNNLGVLYEKQGKYIRADSAYQVALKIREQIVGKNHFDYGRSLNSLAGLNRRLGNYAKAERYYVEAKDVLFKAVGKNHPSYLSVINNLGGLYETNGDYKKAEACYREAIELFETTVTDQPANYASVLDNLGLLSSKQGKYAEAETLHLKALAIREKVLGKEHILYAYTLQNLTLVYNEQGNYGRAEKLARESLPIFEKIVGKNHADYGVAVESLGYVYYYSGDFKQAEVYFKECLGISERTMGKNHAEYATSLSNMGKVYRAQNLFVKAEPYYLECLEIRRKVHGEVHQSCATALSSLASLYDNLGYADKAESFYLEAIKIYEALLGKDHPSIAITQQNLASVYQSSDRLDVAEGYFLEANRNYINQIHNYFPAMSEVEKEYFYEKIKLNFEKFNSFGVLRSVRNPVITSVMYDNRLITKSLLFNSNGKIRRLVLSSGDSTLINKFETWQQKRDLLVKAFQMNLQQRNKAGIVIDSLEEEINTLEKEISIRSGIGSSKSKESISWKDVKKSLRKGEAAIELIRYRKHGYLETITDSSDSKLSKHILTGLTDTVYYAALIVTPKSKNPEVVILKNGNDLENKYIKGYNNSIKFKQPDTLSYEFFWKPIGNWLTRNKIKKIYVSQDGVYNSININVLFDPASNKYLSDQLDIEVVTNTRDITSKVSKTERHALKKASLFGYPNYLEKETSTKGKILNDSPDLINSTDSLKRFFAGGVISRLPATQTEVNSIAGLLSANGVEVMKYMDQQASEEQAKRLTEFQVLHIATHGYFLQNIGDVATAGFAGFDSRKIAQNPLLRSGLLMAGSQQAINGQRNPDEEDGILTAYEAMNLNLDKTELVVLSACETGLGEIKNGEGVYGLQRAFQTAGAKSVLMSFWKVDDNATQELMTAFYKNWLESGNKREAFKKAQASVRTKYKHPYYWGAFVLVGE